MRTRYETRHVVQVPGWPRPYLAHFAGTEPIMVDDISRARQYETFNGAREMSRRVSPNARVVEVAVPIPLTN